MNEQFHRMLVGWRTRAAELRLVEAHGQAAALELAATELEREMIRQESELLTVAEASRASGYSEDHLRELVRAGDLPSESRAGKKSRIRIPRRALPKKQNRDGRATMPIIDYDASEDARNIAMQLRR